ncbi:hypothetical protein LCGC14_1772730 [marine sediment metagenome]|uniref:Uncharacterized protein n=1 Tax=marine sediment metagenome TaxID=412755 RepID=A0A0F9HK82_9ZZZZ
MSEQCEYVGIHIHSTRIDLSQAFWRTFVKENTFVGLHWDAEEGELELAFYNSDSDVASRIPIVERSNSSICIQCTKLCRHALRQYKMQRYCNFTIDVTKAGALTVKFKLERM